MRSEIFEILFSSNNYQKEISYNRISFQARLKFLVKNGAEVAPVLSFTHVSCCVFIAISVR